MKDVYTLAAILNNISRWITRFGSWRPTRSFEKMNLSAKLGTPAFIVDKILRARNKFDP